MKRNVGKQRSNMVHDFSQVPSAPIPRSAFSLNKNHKTTIDSGLLYPLFCTEVIPGDTHIVRGNIFARMATPIHPIMDNLYLDMQYFFVPNRLVWDNWEKFMGAQDNPGDSTDFTVPKIGSTPAAGGIFDHFGIVPGVSQSFNALPFRCYNLIWNEWYRHQDLQNSVTVEKGDTDTSANYALLRRGKRFDYYTSCLPFPQKGPGVDLPLGQTAPVMGIGLVEGAGPMPLTNTNVTETGGVADTYEYAAIIANISNMMAFEGENSGGDPAIYADLTNATASTINDLRQSFQIQKLQERDARGGTRYQELVMSHFGVRGGDARLQRPEYLGGSSHPVAITQVPQTSETGTGTPLGNIAGYGIASGVSGFTKSFVEHGFLIGLASVRADLNYQQGLERFWDRTTKYDYYWPALSRIGEQAVKNQEIYVSGSNPTDGETFGYQERYAEYRFAQSKITGSFRSSASASLDAWHLAQDFTALPALNSSFIEERPPVDRVVALTQDNPEFLVDVFFKHKAVRPMPISGAPGYIDHF